MLDTGSSTGRSGPAVTYERHPGAASAALPTGYRRREPEKSVLHGVVREHLETFLERGHRGDGEGYPRFIEREFRRYLECGLLCHGFARLRCPSCGHENLVAFSCKGRLCPSCMGRRTAEIAASLVDQLLPEAGYRQWVLTFPWSLRFPLAADRDLLARLTRAFLCTLFSWQRRRGRTVGLMDGRTGAVTFVQRFGGALNLHPHLHSILPDGLFVPGPQGRLTFTPLPAPTTAEVEELALKVARRISRIVVDLHGEEDSPRWSEDPSLAALQQALAATVRPPVPEIGLEGGVEMEAKPLCAKVAGFTLHAAQAVVAEDRAGLESLCRYGLRAPFSQRRIERHSDGRIIYRLRRPWPHAGGTSILLLDPLDFLRRLAALVPAPYAHMIRYHGVFANRSRDRGLLPAPPMLAEREEASGETRAEPASGLDAAGGRVEVPDSGDLTDALVDRANQPRGPIRRPRLAWAQLLRRVLHVDALQCPRCSAAMVVLAFLSDPSVVGSILRHLHLPTVPPPVSPARSSSEERLDVFEWDVAGEWSEVEFVHDGEPVRGARGCVFVGPHRGVRAPPG